MEIRFQLPVLLGCALLASCDCGGPRTVPFKRPDARPAAPRQTTDASPAADAPQEAGPLSLTFDGGADNPEIEGVKLAFGKTHAVLMVDLEGDGDRDVLAVTEQAAGQWSLLYALTEGDELSGPTPLRGSASPLAAGCTLARAQLSALGARQATVSVWTRCEAPATAPIQALWALSLGRAPRVEERFELLPASGRIAGELTLRAEGRDADGDGRLDLALTFGIRTPEQAQPASLQLAWLDRASGLSRDVREPDTSLTAMASAAERSLQTSTEQALEQARGVLALHAALCRESGRARLALSGVAGLRCGRSEAAGRAATVAALALAQRGALVPALAAYDAMTAPGVSTSAAQRARVRDALMAFPGSPSLQLTSGPSLPAQRATGAHLPRVRFVDEEQLWIDSRPPQLLRFATGELTPVPADPTLGDTLVRDPSGTLAVTAIERTCAGYTLRIDAARKGTPLLGGPPLSRPLLVPRPAGRRCKKLPPHQREDDGGFRLLGWAPQGVVAARRDEVRLMPLTLKGAPAGAARVLDARTPLPVPLPSGRATPDGSRYVEASEFGVLVFERGPRPRVTLWRPQGWRELPGGATDAAISPSGRSVAVVRGARVYVMTRR